MIGHLPSQYIFMLTCCYKPGCMHPVCKKGEPTEPVNWYVGGPPITTLPFLLRMTRDQGITRLHISMLIILNVLNQ